MTDPRPIWEQLDYQHDAIIQASAGTGKTYALVHVVKHLVEKGLDVRNLLLVTFTEKAAGELKERIREILAGTEAARCLDEATICTIHSFCQELLGEYPFESGMQMGTDVADTDKSLIGRAVRSVIGNVDFGLTYKDSYVREMEAWDKTKDTEGLSRALVKRLSKCVMKGLTPDQLVADELKSLRCQMREALSQMPGNASGKTPGAYVLEHTNGGTTLGTNSNANAKYKEYFNQLDGNIEVVVRSDADLESVVDAAGRIAAGKIDFKLGAWDGVKPSETFDKIAGMSPYRELRDIASGILKGLRKTILSKTLAVCYAEYMRLKKRSSAITFNDMIFEMSCVVRDAVADKDNPAKQAFLQAIRSRYRIALVDEFQDTDAKQWAIFQSLFSCKVNKVAGANPEQGCLIVVGDPKQAIYGFRGADIDTYLQARNDIKDGGGQCLTLKTMYRSTKEMVCAFNAVFMNTPGRSSGWFKDMQSNGNSIPYDQVRFPRTGVPEDVKDFKYPDGERAVELLETIPDNTPIVSTKTCLTLFLENMTREMLRLHERKFLVEEPKPMGRMDWSSMCVLAKSHADCEAVQKALRAKGIPCRQYKEAGMFSSVESQTVLALFDYLTLPRTAGNLAALLLTPLFEVPLSEIKRRLETGTGEIEALCGKWRVYVAKCEWAKFFDSVMNDSALGRPHLGDADHVRHRAGVRQIFDRLLERCARAKSLSAMSDALRHWQRDDSEAREDGKVRNKESESDAVQIMTMHAAKGLEYNVVFAPYGYGMMVQNKTPAEEKPAALMEVKRLLYVVLTRARFKLYLPWSRRMSGNSFGDKTALGTFLGAGIRQLYTRLYGKDPNTCVKGMDGVPPNDECTLGRDNGKAASVVLEMCPELPPSRGMKGWRFKWDSFSSLNHHSAAKPMEVDGEKLTPEDPPDGEEEMESLVPKGALSGTVFHEVMERLCENDAEKGEVDFSVGCRPFAEAIAEPSPLLELVRRRLAANGVVNRTGKVGSESTAVSIARMAWNALRTELDFDGDRFALRKVEKADRKAEVNFVLDENEVVGDGSKREGALNGSIDLIVRRPDGRYCIIDWKTNMLKRYDDASVKEAMDDAGYHLQYKIYSYAAEKWLGAETVKGAAYLFVRGGEFKEDEPSGVFKYDKWQEERLGFAKTMSERFADCDKEEEDNDKEDR